MENIVVDALKHLGKDEVRHTFLSSVSSYSHTVQHRGQEHYFKNQPTSENSSTCQLRDLDQFMELLCSKASYSQSTSMY